MWTIFAVLTQPKLNLTFNINVPSSICVYCVYIVHELVLNSINVSAVVLLFLLWLLLLLLFYSKYCNETTHAHSTQSEFPVCLCPYLCVRVWERESLRVVSYCFSFFCSCSLTLHLGGIVAQQSFKLKDCHENDNHTGRGGGLTHILFTGNSPYSKRT